MKQLFCKLRKKLIVLVIALLAIFLRLLDPRDPKPRPKKSIVEEYKTVKCYNAIFKHLKPIAKPAKNTILSVISMVAML